MLVQLDLGGQGEWSNAQSGRFKTPQGDERPDPPRAMVRRREERPLVAIRVGHERLDAPALVRRSCKPASQRA